MRNKRLAAEILLDGNVIMTVDNTLIRAEFGALDRANVTNIADFALYANRGSISFYDVDRYFYANIIDKKKLKVRFYLKRLDVSKKFAIFCVENISLSENNDNKVDISLVSGFLRLQETKPYAAIKSSVNSTFEDVVSYYRNAFADFTVMPSNDFYNINIPCYYIANSSDWSILSQICQATMSRLIEDENGNASFVRPNDYANTAKRVVLSPQNIIKPSLSNFVAFPNPTIDVYSSETSGYIRYDFNLDVYTKIPTEDRKFLELSANNPPNATIRRAIKEDIGNANKFEFCDISGDIRFENSLFLVDSFYLMNKGSYYYPKWVDGEIDNEPFLTIINEDISMGNLDGKPLVQIRPDSNDKVVNLNFTILNSKINYPNDPSKFDPKYLLDTRVSFMYEYLIRNGYETKTMQTTESTEITSKIGSNELLDKRAYNLEKDMYLSSEILEHFKNKYSQGIYCFECECLLNDYYDTNGNLILDGDKLQHLNKYDIVVPYINKNGKTIPYMQNEDGSAKEFRIIGISYLYDGLLTQKLYLQEERNID